MQKININVKKEEEKTVREKLVTIYGGLELDEDEVAFLLLGPDFLLLEEVDLEKAKIDFSIGVTKVRWQRMGKNRSEIVRFQETSKVEEEEKMEEMIHLEERIHDTERSEVRVGKMKCTDMKNNRRIMLPPPRGVKEEAVLEVRRDAWLEAVRKFQQSGEKEKGKEKGKKDNLTESERRGRKKLEEKVRKGKIHVGAANKGKGIVAMHLQMYEEMVKKHVEKDEEVG